MAVSLAVAGDPGPCPWAGSLRPVTEAKRRTKKGEGEGALWLTKL